MANWDKDFPTPPAGPAATGPSRLAVRFADPERHEVVVPLLVPLDIEGERIEALTVHRITAGEMIAGRNGLTLRIDDALGSVAYPDGEYRHQQSDLDFLGRLVERANGLLKISGDVLAIAERGSGKNAAGKALPVIQIAKADCKDWSFTPGDRPTHGKVSGSWIDQKTGKKKVESKETGLEGPLFGLRDPFKTEAEAKKAVEAKAKELSRKSGTVNFTVPGTAIGGAGSDVNATGFRPEINGTWRAKSVEHTFTGGASGGWTTKFDCTAPEGGKKKGK